MRAGTVQSLWRFPVKSMQGEPLDEAQLTEVGIPGDRTYAVVDELTGKVASAKHPRKWAALLGCSARWSADPQVGEEPPPVVITLPDGSEVASDDATVHSQLSALLDRPVRLTSSAPEQRTMEEVWPSIEGLAPAEFIEHTTVDSEDGDPVSDITMAMAAPPGTFFDLATLHLVTTSTLARLAELQPGSSFDVRRYRPNIVVDTPDPGFVENDWPGQVLQIGDARIAVAIPTMRCIMTTMAQPGLPRDVATLQAIARHNRLEIAGLGTWACAGVYAGVAAGGRLVTGAEVST